jgi:O-antigen ligase
VERVKMAVAMFQDHPATGVGFGNFRRLFDDYHVHDGPVPEIAPEHKVVDNMYPTLLGEAGLLGLSAFLVFAGSLFLNALSARKRTDNMEHRTLLLMLMAGQLGLLLSMVGYEMLYWPGPNMFFCLFCGFLAGATSAEWRSPPPSHTQPVAPSIMLS